MSIHVALNHVAHYRLCEPGAAPPHAAPLLGADASHAWFSVWRPRRRHAQRLEGEVRTRRVVWAAPAAV